MKFYRVTATSAKWCSVDNPSKYKTKRHVALVCRKLLIAHVIRGLNRVVDYTALVYIGFFFRLKVN